MDEMVSNEIKQPMKKIKKQDTELKLEISSVYKQGLSNGFVIGCMVGSIIQMIILVTTNLFL